jgi:hypothetical protein
MKSIDGRITWRRIFPSLLSGLQNAKRRVPVLNFRTLTADGACFASSCQLSAVRNHAADPAEFAYPGA